jgi:hypothetical protein
MRFAARLAEEYIFNVRLSSVVRANKAQQKNITPTALTLLSFVSGGRITEYQHSRKP